MVHLPTNPYITDRPIEGEPLFYGRTAEFDWVEQSCIRGERILILHGPAKIGKTSFLHQLARKLSTTFVVVYIDLQREESATPELLNWHVAKALARRLTDSGSVVLQEPTWEEYLARAQAVLSDLLRTAEQELNGRRLLVVLDGVEALMGGEAEGAGLWSLVGNLTREIDRLNRVHIMFVGREADKLQGPRPPRLAHAAVRRLGAFSMNAATSLVIEPVRDTVAYEPSAVRRIVELASGHPYYIQLICQALYGDAVERTWTISLRDVERVVEKLLSGHVGEFEKVWDDSTASERMVLTALGSIRGSHGVFTRQEVGNALRRERVQVTQNEVTDNLESLVARGVLERLGAMTYRFRVDMMRVWLRHRRSLAEAVAPLGRDRRSEEIAVGTLRHMVLGTAGILIVVVVGIFAWWPRGVTRPDAVAGVEPTLTSVHSGSTPVVSLVGPTPTSTPHPTPTRPRIRMRSLPTIAYFAREDRQSPWQIWVMGSDGKDPVRITHSESNETGPFWSPKGDRLVFVSERDGNREIYTMTIDGANVTRLTNHPADDWMPVWSPDGEEIAFVSRRYGNWEIFTIKPDGTELTRLTETQANNWTPAYSPDGQEIVFASNRDDDWEIYVMNRDGSMPLRLTNVPGNDFSPAWSPRGDRIVFESTRDGNAEIYVMNRDGSEQVNLSRAPLADDHWPCWSPDGERIAFQSNRDGDWDIFVVTLEGTNLTNLTRNRPGSKQGPSWRP